MSPKAASLALKWGFKDVRVYLLGEPGWKKAGYYTESTPEYILKENIVLIDLRDPKVIDKTGFIPKAVNIPLSELPKAEEKFPTYKKAPIVLYSDNKEDAIKALKIIKAWGYPNVTIYSPGFMGWILRGYDIKTGASIPTQITYKRTYAPNEVSAEDFLKAVETGKAFIIDVRNPDEYKKGHFKGAINIPVDEIHNKISLIPVDKPVYLYCNTGVRAEMAYVAIKGICPCPDLKILKAETDCEGMECTINE